MKAYKILVILAGFFLAAAAVHALRPTQSETAERRCQDLVWELGRRLEKLGDSELERLAGARRGALPIDAKVLTHLMARDSSPQDETLYDEIPRMEAGISHCRYFCVFNLDLPKDESRLFLLDTSHGVHYDALRTRFDTKSPRVLFRNVCKLMETPEAYETASASFLAETEREKKRTLARAQDTGIIWYLARFWYLLLLAGVLDFLVFDLGAMKNERTAVKLYLLGLYLAGIAISLSIVMIHFTGVPLPDVRSYILAGPDACPKEIRLLGDVILAISFAWWPVSVVAVFLAGKYGSSPLIPLAYVIAAPMGLAMSESPFGGTQKVAFPVVGIGLVFFYGIYIKLAYKSGGKKDDSPSPEAKGLD
ncbi:MAG TPA: hypothetical protein PLP29_09480 [Candidatus Ozemobacteraceae bacterium]|nr:hypothetical protein [Candidatus Ozemobacteraceae bacterium]